jgi:2-C-methyl-D-erythritol 2,4-cyclodiphosphate synthase
VSDALLGAAGLGDIGQHFPDTDPKWKGADSMQILRAVVEKVHAAGWKISNVDVNVVCEQPKIAPHRETMQHNLALVLGAPASVKGRRAERLGSIGRSEGIMCLAVALLTS